ncbi:unnamed protein product [Ceutorhynchus assimilis]|uniref:Calcitonin receptor n=1 Tax=Ceutorhynchus assimilis TaxID=467358 RepID=A0A9N9MPS6_9CUCU|nr:unnamed protein product [Ceutorhynchus assimilis]
MANYSGGEYYDYLNDIVICGNKSTALPGWCPEIFDSILCWPETPPGTIANQSCPSQQTHLAFKKCLGNGSWYVNEENVTWTDYQHCARSSDEVLEFYRCINFLYIIGYSISSVALIISIIIFFLFRTLRCTRIRIHIHLFISFTISNMLNILWYTMVVTNVNITSANPAWCQLLYVAKEYFMVANYMWMFCEALHLHIALVLVFLAEEKTMKWFYVIGWGSPCFIILVHNLVRVFYSQDTGRCFMEEISFSTWFISVPIVITLAFSMIFLFNILRVILTIMHPTSLNPATAGMKKAVRAAFILTPLFGLQFILIPVKPHSQHPMYYAYQYVSAVITAFQGLCCAILFCFANHEVHQAFKRSLQRKINFQNTRSTPYPTADSATAAPIINGHTKGHVQNGNAIPLLSMYRNSYTAAEK